MFAGRAFLTSRGGRRSDAAQGMKRAPGDGPDHDSSADQGEAAGSFADEEQHPEWIQNWLNNRNEHGFKGGDPLERAGIEEIGEAELHQAE